MPLHIYDLTDLLGIRDNSKYWYVKRKHEDKWYYLKETDDTHSRVIWTRNKEQAIPYAFESSAKQTAEKLHEHGKNLELSEEPLE